MGQNPSGFRVSVREVVARDNRTVELIINRGASAGVDMTAGLAEDLTRYVELLAKWNSKINLTALPVDIPTAGAIDRLIIEPLIAARIIRREDERSVDVGSGGGSPAIPLALSCPWLRMALVESRVRKAAFLREAIRHLGLTCASVENCRLEELADRLDYAGSVDVVTMRAVRANDGLLSKLAGLLDSRGRILAFGGIELSGTGQLQLLERVVLGDGNYLDVLGVGEANR